MTPPNLALYITCLFVANMARTATLKQSSLHFQSDNVGESVTLPCVCEDNAAVMFYWYKQTLGQKPKQVSTFYPHNNKGTFHDEFNNNPRFSLDTENGKNHLKISDLQISDSATYYCVGSNLLDFEFCEGTMVSVKGSGLNIPAFVQPSVNIQPGGSKTLNCALHAGTCDGDHSVYWFRNSEESHPGLIYTHGGRNDQCERKPNTQTHTCVYNLPVGSLNPSHDGIYYCAVASCGHILFGDEIKLDFEDGVDSLVLVYFLRGSLTFASILSVLLAFSVCMMSKRSSCQSTESQARLSAPSTANTKGYQHAETLYNAALSVNLHNRSRRQRDPTWSECVYYSVKQ